MRRDGDGFLEVVELNPYVTALQPRAHKDSVGGIWAQCAEAWNSTAFSVEKGARSVAGAPLGLDMVSM